LHLYFTFCRLFNFAVLPNELPSTGVDPNEEAGFPDWAIAVIVIGLGSLVFVAIFGVAVVS